MVWCLTGEKVVEGKVIAWKVAMAWLMLREERVLEALWLLLELWMPFQQASEVAP